MSGLHFRPGKKGGLRKVLNKLFFCHSSPGQIPFTGTNETCLPCEGIGCIQEKVNQIKTGYTDPTQPQSFRVAQLATQRLGGRTIFGDFGLGLRISANARTNNTYLGGIEGQPGGSPRPLRNRF